MVIANLTPSQLKLYFDNSLPEFQKMIDYQLEESTIFRLIVNRTT